MINSITYPKAEIINDSLKFSSESDFHKALKTGVFYVKFPESFNGKELEKFATSYYLEKDGGEDDSYKGFIYESFNESILGYSNPNDQVEFLQLEYNLWEKYFPKNVSHYLSQMNEVSRICLKSILYKLNVNEEEIDLITGGINQNKGLQYCIFNHYRSTRNGVGFTAHKDSGFITTLYSLESGLEEFVDNHWIPIDPISGFFTVNLGHSLEVLTAKTTNPIHAVFHRVRKTNNNKKNITDRFSVGSYIGPRFDMNLYQYNTNKNLEIFTPFIDFQIAKAKEMNYEFHPRVN